MKDLATLRVLLTRLEDALRAGGEVELASLVSTALAGSDEAVARFLVSDELWGGPGSIADWVRSGTGDQDARSTVETELAQLGEAQIEMEIVHGRTESWVTQPKAQDADRSPSPMSAVRWGLILVVSGLALAGVGAVFYPDSNLGGGWSMFGGIAFAVGQLIFLVGGIAWAVGRVVDRRERLERSIGSGSP